MQNFSGCDELTATQHLLAAVYDGDLVRDGSDSNRKDKDHAAIPQHIARATHKDKVCICTAKAAMVIAAGLVYNPTCIHLDKYVWDNSFFFAGS